MFAVLLTGAKQYLVKEGDVIQVEKLSTPAHETHRFEKVLLLSKDGTSVQLGSPFLNAVVEAKVLEQGRSKKIRVVKMKAKKNYKRISGHRQPFTRVRITKIV